MEALVPEEAPREEGAGRHRSVQRGRPVQLGGGREGREGRRGEGGGGEGGGGGSQVHCY